MQPSTSGTTELVTDRPELLAPVLARVVGALAARRDLSVDRVSDAVLVTDAIAAAAPARFSDGRVRLGLDDREGGIELRIGPMKPGAAAQIRRGAGGPRGRRLAGGARRRADGRAVRGRRVPSIIRFAACSPDLLARFAPGRGAGCARRASGSGRSARRSATGSCPRRSAAAAPAARARRGRAARRRARPAPSTSSKPSSSSPTHSAGGASSDSSPPAGRSSESGRRLWFASSTSSTSVCSSSSRSAISPTDGERCSSLVSSVIALSTSAMRSCRPRGTRTVQTRSRKWRFSSPRMVGEAKAVKGMPRSGSKRSIALTRPRLATWSRSSKDSLAPR